MQGSISVYTLSVQRRYRGCEMVTRVTGKNCRCSLVKAGQRTSLRSWPWRGVLKERCDLIMEQRTGPGEDMARADS